MTGKHKMIDRSTMIDRYEADKSCRSIGGQLLHVTSEEQQQLALALYDTAAVAGLLAADGGLWMRLNGKQWRWITGIIFRFKKLV